MRASTSIARMTAGQVDTIVRPSAWRIARPPCIFSHGGAGASHECVGPSQLPSIGQVTRRIVEQGFSVASVTAALSYGTAGLAAGGVGSAGRLDTAVTYHRANLSGTADPMVMFGISMGTTNIVEYALEHPGDVACLVLFLPVMDLVTAYEDDINGNRAGIAAAWGVTFPAALPADADIQGRAAELQDVPILAFYGGADPYAPDIGDFASASGATIVEVGSGLGHVDAVIAGADLDLIAEFVTEHTRT